MDLISAEEVVDRLRAAHLVKVWTANGMVKDTICAKIIAVGPSNNADNRQVFRVSAGNCID